MVENGNPGPFGSEGGPKGPELTPGQIKNTKKQITYFMTGKNYERLPNDEESSAEEVGKHLRLPKGYTKGQLLEAVAAARSVVEGAKELEEGAKEQLRQFLDRAVEINSSADSEPPVPSPELAKDEDIFPGGLSQPLGSIDSGEITGLDDDFRKKAVDPTAGPVPTESSDGAEPKTEEPKPETKAPKPETKEVKPKTEAPRLETEKPELKTEEKRPMLEVNFENYAKSTTDLWPTQQLWSEDGADIEVIKNILMLPDHFSKEQLLSAIKIARNGVQRAIDEQNTDITTVLQLKAFLNSIEENADKVVESEERESAPEPPKKIFKVGDTVSYIDERNGVARDENWKPVEWTIFEEDGKLLLRRSDPDDPTKLIEQYVTEDELAQFAELITSGSGEEERIDLTKEPPTEQYLPEYEELQKKYPIGDIVNIEEGGTRSEWQVSGYDGTSKVVLMDPDEVNRTRTEIVEDLDRWNKKETPTEEPNEVPEEEPEEKKYKEGDIITLVLEDGTEEDWKFVSYNKGGTVTISTEDENGKIVTQIIDKKYLPVEKQDVEINNAEARLTPQEADLVALFEKAPEKTRFLSGKLINYYRKNVGLRVAVGVTTTVMAGATNSDAISAVGHLARVIVGAVGGGMTGESASSILQGLALGKLKGVRNDDRTIIAKNLEGIDQDDLSDAYATLVEIASAQGLKIDAGMFERERKQQKELKEAPSAEQEKSEVDSPKKRLMAKFDSLKHSFQGLSIGKKAAVMVGAVLLGTGGGMLVASQGAGVLGGVAAAKYTGLGISSGMQLAMGFLSSQRQRDKGAFEQSDMVEAIRHEFARRELSDEDFGKVQTRIKEKVEKNKGGRKKWAIGGAIVGATVGLIFSRSGHDQHERGVPQNQHDVPVGATQEPTQPSIRGAGGLGESPTTQTPAGPVNPAGIPEKGVTIHPGAQGSNTIGDEVKMAEGFKGGFSGAVDTPQGTTRFMHAIGEGLRGKGQLEGLKPDQFDEFIKEMTAKMKMEGFIVDDKLDVGAARDHLNSLNLSHDVIANMNSGGESYVSQLDQIMAVTAVPSGDPSAGINNINDLIFPDATSHAPALPGVAAYNENVIGQSGDVNSASEVFGKFEPQANTAATLPPQPDSINGLNIAPTVPDNSEIPGITDLGVPDTKFAFEASVPINENLLNTILDPRNHHLTKEVSDMIGRLLDNKQIGLDHIHLSNSVGHVGTDLKIQLPDGTYVGHTMMNPIEIPTPDHENVSWWQKLFGLGGNKPEVSAPDTTGHAAINATVESAPTTVPTPEAPPVTSTTPEAFTSVPGATNPEQIIEATVEEPPK